MRKLSSIPVLEDEEERLNELGSLCILDSPADESYDRYTRLVATLFDVPITAISLIDETRQWFKSIQGLDATETPREISFCTHTIMDAHVLVVPDATKDPRFSGNPLVTGDPKLRFYAGAPLITHNGFRLGTICVLDTQSRNITDQQKQLLALIAEMIVRQMEERVNFDRMAERSRQLALAKQEAERANHAKSEFLASMSHELRTPMNAILGFTQLLLENPLESLSEQQRQSAEFILRGGHQLLELINQALDLNKIETGRFDLEPEEFSPSELFVECAELLEAAAEKRNIVLTQSADCGATLFADRARLRQVLLNLMTNAIKYNVEGGSVILGCADLPDDRVRLFVTDTGRGIPAEKADGLFEPFNRLGLETQEIDGTGIGLTITKKLIEAMGGIIGFESEVAVGSKFWVDLPARQLVELDTGGDPNSTEPYDVPADTGGATAKPGLVLYIEDNPANLRLMEMIFSRLDGLTLISAPNAEIGLEIAAGQQPDVVLMDINLPGIDGYQALSAIHSDNRTMDIPVIAVSASAMPKEIEKGQQAGFRNYLTKPILIDELVSSINACL